MSEELAISLRGVSKCFKRYDRPVDRLKELLIPGKSRAQEFWALRDIDLDVPKGQTLGIVGRNGSGKSTLLQIIAGTLTPTTGTVQVNGRVSALLELGSGFNPEFTGRQNVFFNGQLLGLTKGEVEERFDDIAGFADIGDFIDQPVKTYSSGMFVRLAFAVAVHVDPEVLIVDEALSVGDFVFQHRCMRHMRSLMDSGVTTLFVSHDHGAVKTLCDTAIMIHHSQVVRIGEPDMVINHYLKLITDEEITLAESHQPSHSLQVLDQKETVQRGSGKASILKVIVLDENGNKFSDQSLIQLETGESVTLVIQFRANQELENWIIGFFLCDKNGNELIGSNTQEEGLEGFALQKGQRVEVRFKFNLSVRPGSYSLTVAGSQSYTDVTFDWLDNLMILQVLPDSNGRFIHALVDIPYDVCVSTESELAKV